MNAIVFYTEQRKKEKKKEKENQIIRKHELPQRICNGAKTKARRSAVNEGMRAERHHEIMEQNAAL